MIKIDYQKRKNIALFKNLAKQLSIESPQNYIPIYNKFFSLKENNYNKINLNHTLYIKNIINEESVNIYSCTLENIHTTKSEEKSVFFKMAPLLDPFKFICGDYEKVKNLNTLPDFGEPNIYEKYLDMNNSAYIDSFFVYLTSMLLHNEGFVHGLDFYGSFLCMKDNYNVDVIDEIEYLNNNSYFQKNINTLFYIDEEYFPLFENNKYMKQNQIIIHNDSVSSLLSVETITDVCFTPESNSIPSQQKQSLDDIEIFPDSPFSCTSKHQGSIQSGSYSSSCSSYTTNTSDSDSNSDLHSENTSMNSDTLHEDEYSDYISSDDGLSFTDEVVYIRIPKFPVQIICMEKCENTMDAWIIDTNRDVEDSSKKSEEWLSLFMQIIMMLITYQEVFSFTHNDLHTNNIMYIPTNKKYLYYKYDNNIYRVPTFGKIWKIIDFGRSIYTFDNKLFCSDSYKADGDANSLYNIEPYFNPSKPVLEPNFSFDLCRLACSIYDFIITDDKNDPIQKIILDWCMDDNGKNILYKKNGKERYPDFKLYKMISRCVHNHTPQKQLIRPEFKKYIYNNSPIKETIINIDYLHP
jgi:hypothetical protein